MEWRWDVNVGEFRCSRLNLKSCELRSLLVAAATSGSAATNFGFETRDSTAFAIRISVISARKFSSPAKASNSIDSDLENQRVSRCVVMLESP